MKFGQLLQGITARTWILLPRWPNACAAASVWSALAARRIWRTFFGSLMGSVGRWWATLATTRTPYLAQGITDSFRDAELLAEAIDAGFSGRQPLAEALADYEQQRNAAVMPIYEFTLQLANLAAPPSPARQQLFAALCGNQAETNRFFGTLAGTVPIPEFFAPENVQRIISAR